MELLKETLSSVIGELSDIRDRLSTHGEDLDKREKEVLRIAILSRVVYTLKDSALHGARNEDAELIHQFIELCL
jgi:hypothetical protein